MLIDREVGERVEAKRRPRVLLEQSAIAIAFGRLTLEKAVDHADLASWQHTGDLGGWEGLVDRARGARTALEKLAPYSPKSDSLRRNQLRVTLFQTRFGAGTNANVVRKRAYRDALLLAQAIRLTRRIEADARSTKARIAEHFVYQHHPDQRAFVQTMGEGWAFLTGARPGANADPAKNPFLRFAIAGWHDWRSAEIDTPQFVGALRSARDFLSLARVGEIVRDGPTWAPILQG